MSTVPVSPFDLSFDETTNATWSVSWPVTPNLFYPTSGEDVGAPSAVEEYPAESAVEVPVGSDILLVFDKAIDPATVTAASFRVLLFDTPIDGARFVSGPCIRFTPNAPLAFGQNYHVTASTDIKGTNGTNLAAPVAWSFTTETGDLSIPTVGSFSPTPGSTISKTAALSFQATDVGANLKRVFVVVAYDATGDVEVVHDGDQFMGHFARASTRTPITNGYAYTVVRYGGWPSAPRVRVFALDDEGNEA